MGKGLKGKLRPPTIFKASALFSSPGSDDLIQLAMTEDTHRLEKIILLAIAFTTPSLANFAEVHLETLGTCIYAGIRTDSPIGSAALYLDTDLDTTNGVRTRIYTSNSSRANLRLCGLKPDTKYYVTVSTANHGALQCTSSCFDCDLGSGALDGVDCEASGEPPTFHTSQGYAPVPTPPELPSHSFDPTLICDSPPSTSRTISCSDGVALDWKDKWADARAQHSDLVHEIKIPSGCLVQEDNGVSFTRWTGPGNRTGGVVVRTAGDSRLFPPAGVRVDPSYENVLGGFLAPTNRSAFGASGAYSPFRFRGGATGICFQNIKFSLPPAEDTNQIVRLVGVEGAANNTLRIAEPLPQGVHDTDSLIVDFDDCKGLQGAKNAWDADAGERTIRLAGGPYEAEGPCRNGRGIYFSGSKIASIESTTPVRLHFTSEHGFYSLEQLPIESIVPNGDQTSTIHIASPMHMTREQRRYITVGDTVRIAGSSTALDDRMYTVLDSGTSEVRVAGSATCFSDCGTIREHHSIVIADADLDEVNGVHFYEVVDFDTIELLDVTIFRSGGSGGYAVNDVGIHAPLLFLQGQSRIAFDRVLGDCGLFPYRMVFCVAAGGTKSVSLQNSFFWGPKKPFLINSRSGRIHDSVETSSNAVARFFDYNSSSDVQIRNTTVVDTHGIVFGGDNACSKRMSDITLQRVFIDKPNRHIAGHPKSNGMYYNDRHGIEFKCGERILLEGVRVAGSWADGTPAAPAVVFRGIGGGEINSTFPTRDITIRGLHISRSASGIQVLQGSITDPSPPIQRFSLTHSLFEELDYHQYASKPGQISGLKKANCCNFAGSWLQFSGDQSDIYIANNTLGEQRCRGIGCLVDLGGGFKSRFVFEKNVAPLSKTFVGFGLDQEDNGRNAFNPSCEQLSSGREIWECQVHQIEADGTHLPDSSSVLRDNVFFGGLEQMYVSKTAFDIAALSNSNATTVTAEEVENYFDGWTSGNFYPGGATMADRVDATFKPGSWESKLTDRGFDPRLFRAYQGLLGEVELHDLGNGLARLTYEAPEDAELNPERCWVDYSLDPAFGLEWWQGGGRIMDNGSSGSRSMDLSELLDNRTYSWRLSCPATQVRGTFRTGVR